MAEWIEKLGDYLADNDPEKFRLTPERHWEIKGHFRICFNNSWIKS